MIRQTVFSFKLQRTAQRVTACSGLVLFGEFMEAMGVRALVSRHLPKPGSGRGFESMRYVGSLSMMLYGVGEAIEDVREIREDDCLRQVVGLGEVPSSSAIGDWLRRMGERGGIGGMERVNDGIVRKVLRRDDSKGYTLIIDPTLIESDKREARMSYLGFKGYRPVVATLKENGLAIAYEFKQGNDSGGKLRILKKAFGKMPRGKRIDTVLLDSEYYSHEVIEAIGTVSDWRAFRTEEGIMTDREVSETVHTTSKGKSAFRLIVLRWKDRQGDLFGDSYHYQCIATGMIDAGAEQVVWRYNQRAHIENHIKEIRSGFGMDRMPCGEFLANSVHFAIGMMTYNLFIAQRLFVVPESWRTKTIKKPEVVIDRSGRQGRSPWQESRSQSRNQSRQIQDLS
jgi:hypothetical protein